MKMRLDLMGRRMVEGRTFGRVWRLWFKQWAWPYAFHQWGVRCAGIGPLGFQMFDKVSERPDGT